MIVFHTIHRFLLLFDVFVSKNICPEENNNNVDIAKEVALIINFKRCYFSVPE